ncbi:recombinase RecT [Candidatus Saccharibacteria bacterium]|nr:recombinase RecT [Candidatus Saccharibacteria bacterium]
MTNKLEKKPTQDQMYRKMADHIGDWADGISKTSILRTIHKNILGLNKLGHGRPYEDLGYFLLVARQYNLNPLKKEIYAVYQNTNVNGNWVETLEPIVGIHGLRTLARRAKNPAYAYTGKAVFTFKDEQLDSATVEVFGRFGDNANAVKVGEYTAYWEEFAQKKKSPKAGESPYRSQWAKMPRVMLAKCAEANAIRACFDIGGIYIPEEIGSEDFKTLTDGDDSIEGC